MLPTVPAAVQSRTVISAREHLLNVVSMERFRLIPSSSISHRASGDAFAPGPSNCSNINSLLLFLPAQRRMN